MLTQYTCRLREVIVCKDADMGRSRDLACTCQELDFSITSACRLSRRVLEDKWLPKLADHLVRYTCRWKDMSHYLTDCFFRTIYTIMSAQLRQFTVTNLQHFQKYFTIYNASRPIYLLLYYCTCILNIRNTYSVCRTETTLERNTKTLF
jgi:hypothetical protein